MESLFYLPISPSIYISLHNCNNATLVPCACLVRFASSFLTSHTSNRKEKEFRSKQGLDFKSVTETISVHTNPHHRPTRSCARTHTHARTHTYTHTHTQQTRSLIPFCSLPFLGIPDLSSYFLATGTCDGLELKPQLVLMASLRQRCFLSVSTSRSRGFITQQIWLKETILTHV
jgi:hypothetical protein